MNERRGNGGDGASIWLAVNGKRRRPCSLCRAMGPRTRDLDMAPRWCWPGTLSGRSCTHGAIACTTLRVPASEARGIREKTSGVSSQPLTTACGLGWLLKQSFGKHAGRRSSARRLAARREGSKRKGGRRWTVSAAGVEQLERGRTDRRWQRSVAVAQQHRSTPHRSACSASWLRPRQSRLRWWSDVELVRSAALCSTR